MTKETVPDDSRIGWLSQRTGEGWRAKNAGYCGVEPGSQVLTLRSEDLGTLKRLCIYFLIKIVEVQQTCVCVLYKCTCG